MSYYHLGSTTSSADAKSLTRVETFQAGAVKFINDLNSHLARLVAPLGPAIDKIPASTTYKALLKTRPLDALLELNRPIENTLLDVVNWVNRSDWPDGGKGSTTRMVGFPKMKIMVDMRPVNPDDAKLPAEIRNWVQRVRLITQFMILVVYAPIATGYATLKFFGKNLIVDPIAAAAIDAQILAPVMALHAKMVVLTSNAALAVAIPANKMTPVYESTSDLRKKIAELKASPQYEVLQIAGKTLLDQLNADVEQTDKRIRTAVAAFAKGASIAAALAGQAQETVNAAGQTAASIYNSMKSSVGFAGTGYSLGAIGAADEYTDCGTGWYSQDFNLGAEPTTTTVASGAATTSGGGTVAAAGASGGGTGAATAATAKATTDTIAPEILAALATILKTANDSGLTEQMVREAAEAAKQGPPKPNEDLPGGDAAQTPPPQAQQGDNTMLLLGAAAVAAVLFLRK